jgi:tetratricopeptide (TPR) repeat protein
MFRRSLSALVLGLAVTLGGCVSVPDSPPAGRRVGGADREPREAPVPDKDRVLHDYRLAASALRAGRYDEAKARLDDAILRIGGIITNDEQAAKARGLFNAESSKPFIGEPYERVMAYYYRGILYWRDGQPDNARACFRSGQVIDSDPVNEKYDADYVLLDYLEGLASVKLQADGADAWARAQAHAGERLKLAPYHPAANVLVFAEFGYGPRKYAAGQYGEQLRFRVEDSPSRSARLILDGGRRVVPLPVYDDLGYQAATRGGRVMDYILGNKAYFKTGANVAGDLALFGAIIASQEARRKEWRGQDGSGANNLALGLGLLGVIGKVAAAATQAQADTRQWNNLPQRLSFAALKLPPGEHAGRLEFLDRMGNVLPQRTQQVRFSVGSDARDTVVFLSELRP